MSHPVPPRLRRPDPVARPSTQADAGGGFALIARADLAAAATRWLAHLAAERRASALTVDAYRRDLVQFLRHLASTDGEVPGLETLLRLVPADLRGFMAARRAQGIESRSLARSLAALRSFARHLERAGIGKASAFAAVRGPKLARSLPKPLAPAAARDLVDVESRAGDNRPQWILARDAAVLALLYGAGLRISEALGIRRAEAPVDGRDEVTIVGKGRKTRTVPVIAPVQRALADYLALVPMRCRRRDRFSSARRVDPCRRVSFSSPSSSCAAPSACRTTRRHMHCGTRSPRTCSAGAATCAPSKSCSVMPRSRRRSSTPQSMPSG